ncbi:hypothetical protein N7G274_008722 [Stereocaulon virgatum]|uniref:TM7S3/TM198-like domain-containing protein n=1 Tax=Stereocaulon virgatum TaxID=373712 RepID=A0ABR3ZYC5_9LECA
MRVQWLYTAASIFLVTVNHPVVTAERYAVLPRQDLASAPAAAASTTPQASLKSINEASSTATFESPLPSVNGASPSSATGKSSASGISTNANGPSSLSSPTLITATPIPKGSLNVTTSNTTQIEGLPIHPAITPALSVAGALLILTGAFYTLVGIKTKWLHVFLSPAYLASLGVTILIIYVMSPPVSTAIQGAFFVAACLTGIIAGGVSVIFADITEGLGCFLGGFCLSMWFLVLKSGGLISSTTGKIIFIALFTVGGFALYISHWTRPYALIASISFAGATVIVIGVDCFSRAGLKEFWLYIWNLNEALFPLHYSQPYPITRGIRVEIAAIILLFLLGIMSQMKIWKIIKERREEREADRKRKEHQRQLSDEEQGKRVEKGNAVDRAMWEHTYGDKDRTNLHVHHPDSGFGTDEPSSTRKGSLSEAEGIEMEDLKGSTDGSKGRVRVHVARDSIYEVNPTTGERLTDSIARVFGELVVPSGSGATVPAVPHIDPNLTLQPQVVHLPFKVPNMDAQSDDSLSSVAASAASGHLPDRSSQRPSSTSVMKRLSKRSQTSYVAMGTSEEALVVPHIDDDRRSSIAATIDFDEEAMSRSETPALDKRASQASLDMLRAQIHESLDPSFIPEYSPEPSVFDAAAATRELPASKSPSIASSRRSSTGSIANAKGHSVETPGIPENHEQGLGPIGLSGNLPEGASKVVMAYRTNEWAKHLDGAESPEVDPLTVNKRQSQAPAQQGESAAPVNVRELQQTPLNAEPAPAITHADLPSSKRRSSTLMSRNPFSRPKEGQQSRPSLHPLTVAKNVERMPSQTSLVNSVSRTSSQTSLNSNQSRNDNYRPPLPKFRASSTSLSANRNPYRSSSGPLATSPLVDSPIEEDIESSFPTRFTPQPNHLMSQRDRIITSKPSSTSLLRTSYSNVALDQHPAYRSMEEDDDMPLAQRKSMLQQKRSSSGPSGAATPQLGSGTATPLRRSGSSTPYLLSGNATPQRLSNGPNPSLYPARPLPAPRDSTVSQWRASLQPSTTAHLQDQEIEARRADMLREKQRQSSTKQEQQYAQGVRASVLDQGMRRGSMMDLHKAAMRKMQGDVKL